MDKDIKRRLGLIFGFVLLGTAQSLTVVFLSRILDGLLGGNISLARAYITDVTDEKNRARGLGIIGAAFGLGLSSARRWAAS